jgi:FkbH-like protein
MGEAIRLVIWDLDETFWRGTLTEGGISYLRGNHELVIELAQRGIMSSICSKNDMEAVKKVLVDEGLWEYFIFPSVDWSPKGARIAGIVEACQLRPETILFIDDNPGNRGEAKAAVPGLWVTDETIVSTILSDVAFKGKNDEGLSRLKQYKLLEEKGLQRSKFGSDNAEFLRTSNIRVEIDYDVHSHLDRIIELINRTNQLNFTKLRLAEDRCQASEQLISQINASATRRSGVVKVRDKFGDYGVVGFWMMDGVWGPPSLIHFAFSCRTIGMGIEQWVYHRLGCPTLDIAGEVIADLDFDPGWVNQEGIPDEGPSGSPYPFHSVRLRGGCEIQVLTHLFSFRSRHLTSELLFPRGRQVAWKSHMATFFADAALQSPEAVISLSRLDLIPDDFGTRFFEPSKEPILMVISNSADATADVYRHKRFGFMVPIQFFSTNLKITEMTEEQASQYCSWQKYSESEKDQFFRIRAELIKNYDALSNEEKNETLVDIYKNIIAALRGDEFLIFMLHLPRICVDRKTYEVGNQLSRSRKSAQGDKWNFCLKAA